jgi:hypothetical protein
MGTELDIFLKELKRRRHLMLTKEISEVERIDYKKACEEALKSLEEEYKKGERNMLNKVIEKIKERVWVWKEEKFTPTERIQFNRIVQFRFELLAELNKLRKEGK